MPGLVEIIPALIALSISSGGGSSATSAPATPTPAQAATTASNTRTTQEAALSQQLPGLQASTGGSLSPDALLQLSQLLSGQAGASGIGSSSQDLITKLFSSQTAAGSGGTGPGLTAG